ncbi:MAG: hypothetical protein Q9201_005087 [Fulgogasparrea decipioides]
MQCLGSPIRKEVDAAHSKGEMLDIGIPSVQNIKAISQNRKTLWAVLVISALPLHFMQDYEPSSIPPLVQQAQSVRDKLNGVTNWRQLSASECLKAYSTQYVSSRGDVLIVQGEPVAPIMVLVSQGLEVQGTSTENALSASGFVMTEKWEPVYKPMPDYSDPWQYPSYQWSCSAQFNKTCMVDSNQHYIDHPLDWTPYGQPVQYCLSEDVHEQCQLNFSVPFAVIVVLSNLAKVLCMLLTVWHYDASALITMGDAIQSFLDRPDPYTQDFCIYSTNLIQILLEWESGKGFGSPFYRFSPSFRLTREDFLNDPNSKQWRPRLWRWWNAASLSSAVGNNIISMSNSISVNVVIANLPQVIMSYVYILFNSLYTCMVAGREWTQFAAQRKTLRVSSPVGAQRSTYWLQLPYRYSIPLIVSSNLLSWLVSQSLFVVKINVLYDLNRSVQADQSILSCGYSPGAIVLAIIVGTFIMLGAVLLGLRTYAPGMPLAATCSAAISAACHAPEDDPDAAVLPVQWGVVSIKNGIGHCCFSSKLVAPPIPGHMYA